MHIDELIRDIRPLIPFRSVESAQEFIDKYEAGDRIAFISSLYLGRSYIHYDEINEDDLQYLQSGKMDRFWEEGNVRNNEIARVLYEKNSNLIGYYDAFIRCTTNSGYDRSRY